MIGPRAHSMLRRLAKTGTRRALAGSLALWVLLALAASNLLSAAGLLGWIDRPAHDGLLILVLSTFPLALFHPPDPRSGRIALRAVDRGTVLESALAAGARDAAEPLLRGAGEDLAASIGRVTPGRRSLSRGARRTCLAAAFIVLVSQGTFVLVAGGPVLGYAERFEPGGRAEEGAAAFSRPEIPEGSGGPADAEAERIPDAMPGSRIGSPAERADREAEFADLHGLLRQGREAVDVEARKNDGPEGEEAPQTQPPAARGKGGSGELSGRSGRTGAGEKDAPGPEGLGEGGEPRGSAGGDQNRGPGSGWSDSPGTSLGRNAMKDYRAAFEKVLTERTGAAVTAGEDLSLAETEAAFSLYFESRILRVDVEPDEDPVAASIRTAWQRLRGGIR